jgi:hypothetical protein
MKNNEALGIILAFIGFIATVQAFTFLFKWLLQ